MESFLKDLKAHIDSLPASTVAWESLAPHCGGLTVRDRVTQDLDFAPPTKVEVVGSFLLRTMAQPSLSVDLAVQMPSQCFHPRDFLNYRYADRRAMYLAVLARSLQDSDLVKDVTVEGFCGDVGKPVLVSCALVRRVVATLRRTR